jgi:hypothetical protein
MLLSIAAAQANTVMSSYAGGRNRMSILAKMVQSQNVDQEPAARLQKTTGD